MYTGNVSFFNNSTHKGDTTRRVNLTVNSPVAHLIAAQVHDTVGGPTVRFTFDTDLLSSTWVDEIRVYNNGEPLLVDFVYIRGPNWVEVVYLDFDITLSARYEMDAALQGLKFVNGAKNAPASGVLERIIGIKRVSRTASNKLKWQFSGGSIVSPPISGWTHLWGELLSNGQWSGGDGVQLDAQEVEVTYPEDVGGHWRVETFPEGLAFSTGKQYAVPQTGLIV